MLSRSIANLEPTRCQSWLNWMPILSQSYANLKPLQGSFFQIGQRKVNWEPIQCQSWATRMPIQGQSWPTRRQLSSNPKPSSNQRQSWPILSFSKLCQSKPIQANPCQYSAYPKSFFRSNKSFLSCQSEPIWSNPSQSWSIPANRQSFFVTVKVFIIAIAKCQLLQLPMAI